MELPDILEEIQNGNLLHWTILSLDAKGHLGEGKSMPVFEKQIHDSEKGLKTLINLILEEKISKLLLTHKDRFRNPRVTKIIPWISYGKIKEQLNPIIEEVNDSNNLRDYSRATQHWMSNSDGCFSLFSNKSL